MKILLFGKNGQVGWELQRALQPLGELIALDHEGSSENEDWCGDFNQPENVLDTIREIKADIIVNAAAYTAVDKAESEIDIARQLNAAAPALLAKAAYETDAWLVHYSTDYVFDGKEETPFVESAPVGPLSVYGQTKWEGEEAIRDANCLHLILRTSWVYGARGANFTKTMLRLGAERDTLSVVSDQIGAPTGADLLADVTAHALRMILARRELAGTYHCTAQGETSWYDYAKFIFDYARSKGAPLKVESLMPVTTADYPTAAKRPLNSRLDCSKIQKAFALCLPNWQVGVKRVLEELLD